MPGRIPLSITLLLSGSDAGGEQRTRRCLSMETDWVLSQEIEMLANLLSIIKKCPGDGKCNISGAFLYV